MRVLCAQATHVFALWCARSQCVCCGAVVHVVPFSCRGVQARLSPLAEAGRMPHLQTQGSKRSHHEETTYTRTPLASIPPTFLARRSTEDRGAPLLCAVCVSPSSQQPPGSGAGNARKLRGCPPGWKTTCGKCLKLHAATLSWRAPRNT